MNHKNPNPLYTVAKAVQAVETAIMQLCQLPDRELCKLLDTNSAVSVGSVERLGTIADRLELMIRRVRAED